MKTRFPFDERQLLSMVDDPTHYHRAVAPADVSVDVFKDGLYTDFTPNATKSKRSCYLNSDIILSIKIHDKYIKAM